MKDRKEATDGPGTPTGAALFRQAQAGCRDSLARLMKVHEGLVHTVVRKQVLGDLPFAEALQAGRIGLWRAIPSTPLRASLGFDPQRGTAFSTYAWTSILHQVWREVKLAGRAQSQAARGLSLSEAASYACADRDLARDWEALAVSSALWRTVPCLPITFLSTRCSAPGRRRLAARLSSPKSCPTVLSAAYSRLKSWPESFIPAHHRVLLRLSRPSRACLDLSTPARVAFTPSWPRYCFECPRQPAHADALGGEWPCEQDDGKPSNLSGAIDEA